MRICLLLVFLLLAGCATGLKGSGKIPASDELAVSVPDVEIDDDDENQAVLDEADKTEGVEVFPGIPHEDDAKVEKWVNYFTGKGRKWMQVYLERSGRYLPLMQAILKQHGLPEDLIYIAMIESGFAPSIRSHAGAVGYWQFIAATGRRYGLTINSLLDERRDPIKSTHAAAKYYKSLYNLFGNWYLAFAAYNGGENRVMRSVMKYQTRDFFDLVQNRKALRPETKDYVPKFLAARLIAKDPKKYGFDILELQAPIQFDEITTEKSVDLKKLAQETGIAYEEIKLLNQQFTTQYAPKYADLPVTIRVPTGTRERMIASLETSYLKNQDFLKKIQTATYAKFRVRRGDTLSTIARRFRTSVSRIKDLNDLRSGSMIRAGRYIKVPLGNGYERNMDPDQNVVVKLPAKRTPSSKIEKASRHTNDSKVHVVRRGENLTRIARKYRIPLNTLITANNLRYSSRLSVGSRLIIPD